MEVKTNRLGTMAAIGVMLSGAIGRAARNAQDNLVDIGLLATSEQQHAEGYARDNEAGWGVVKVRGSGLSVMDQLKRSRRNSIAAASRKRNR